MMSSVLPRECRYLGAFPSLPASLPPCTLHCCLPGFLPSLPCCSTNSCNHILIRSTLLFGSCPRLPVRLFRTPARALLYLSPPFFSSPPALAPPSLACTGVDQSPVMIEYATDRLASFGTRAVVRLFTACRLQPLPRSATPQDTRYHAPAYTTPRMHSPPHPIPRTRSHEVCSHAQADRWGSAVLRQRMRGGERRCRCVNLRARYPE